MSQPKAALESVQDNSLDIGYNPENEPVLEALQGRLEQEVRRRLEKEQKLAECERLLESSGKALEKIASSLDEHRRQLDITLNHVLVGTLLVNRHGQIVRTNRTAMQMFGLDNETILETQLPDLFKHPNPDEVSHLILGGKGERLVEQKMPSLHEGVVRRLDGSFFEAEYAFNPVTGLDGRSQTVWIFRDITEQKDREKQRYILEQELANARKFEALGTLASGVAHEINTPMQYVGDNLQFLEQGMETLSKLIKLARSNKTKLFTQACERQNPDFLLKEIPKAIKESRKGVKSVTRILRAIRTYSHPGTDEQKSVINVCETIRDAVIMTCNKWKGYAQIDLELPETPLLTEAVPGEIEQVLVNMIVNAVQALAPEEGGDPDPAGMLDQRISIKALQVSKRIQIRLCDTGHGVPDQIRAKIFDPFFTTKGVGIGSGQGLAISRHIICDRIGGDICLQDTKRGACFIVHLPVSEGELEASTNKGEQNE